LKHCNVVETQGNHSLFEGFGEKNLIYHSVTKTKDYTLCKLTCNKDEGKNCEIVQSFNWTFISIIVTYLWQVHKFIASRQNKPKII